ncbi:MAG: MaoC family dehydratase [Gammaproteobacteria bacterium]
MTTHHIDGPYFEDFTRGQVFTAPAVTLTEGHAAIYQALTGDRMRLPLDRHLAARVTGDPRPLAHPMVVLNAVNGQTTYASQHVKGNLFYRGLLLQQPVFIGDTLATSTRVVGLKQNTIKPGRAATGMVALEMETFNQDGVCVMKYWRCPMIPCRDATADTGHADDFDWIPATLDDAILQGALPRGWDLAPLDPAGYAVPAPPLAAGDRVVIEAQDTVTCAPELVRMTGNMAFAHTDASRSYLGKRLVYGGHTISLALAQVTRAMPNLIAMVGWQGCDHLGPVLEEDIIRSEFGVLEVTPVASGGALYSLAIDTFARRAQADVGWSDERVLDWRLVLWSL